MVLCIFLLVTPPPASSSFLSLCHSHFSNDLLVTGGLGAVLSAHGGGDGSD